MKIFSSFCKFVFRFSHMRFIKSPALGTSLGSAAKVCVMLLKPQRVKVF